MIEITANTVLLDIEGTTSPVAYVYEVLFPFALKNARSYLERCWDEANTLTACDLMARDAGFQSSYDWLNVGDAKREDMIDKVMQEVDRLTKADAKSRGLKELQGFIWAEAYESGKLCSQVFEDVPQALACWKATKILMAIYSSGSATAQRNFFGHTEYGSLTDYFAGFFDTSCGAKKESASYNRIAKLLGREEPEIVFMSDVVAELDAAREAGMQTLLILRPGNSKQEESTHPAVPTFYDVRILQPGTFTLDSVSLDDTESNLDSATGLDSSATALDSSATSLDSSATSLDSSATALESAVLDSAGRQAT